jgi:tetratricopeptide (TPR) repeat protein
MTKENILYSIISLLLGLIVGFTLANSVNRNGNGGDAIPAKIAAGNPALPPDHPPIPGGAGDMARQADPQLLASINALGKGAKDEPKNFEAQIKAAEAFSQIQRYDEAIEFFGRANQLRPDDYETLVRLANANFDGSHFEAAEKFYTAALQKKPDDVNVRTDLGLTFMFRGVPDLDRAVAEFRGSLERDPNHIQTLQNLTVAYTRKGRADEAQAMLTRLEALNSGNPAIPTLRADLEKLRSTPESKAQSGNTSRGQ